MTEDESTPSQWWAYLQANLARRGLSTGDLARGAGVDRSRLTDWKRGGKASVESARAVAALFGVSPLEVMVAAGLLSREEAALRAEQPDPARLGDEELIAELRRRLRR
ncbi:helix-turn-helix domain-containing protein [Saccharothrix algeriensis]|uniref:Helix-turn-helix transcriptional regulator n=1 Tax=Saccharothrix algeriensis TaxID=173560 RepID=A0A8T8I3R8_9PSEU|nr:helix-turn-helix transcriptional regulator [Saccharothrix algeriensis]MBM7811609.1 transcriptional regulator with XRE-family HTH domain [Saccharothrix algeriensis]QTR05406.1 helix-turn-helix transcriptional regulator [Saccharothrix algeriensis]